jgi:hypothetical protein
MKAYGGVDVYIHNFLTSALAGSEWSASRPGRLTPRERAPGTHWIGGWVDPRAGLDDVERRKFLTLPRFELRSLGRPGRSQDETAVKRWSFLTLSRNGRKAYNLMNESDYDWFHAWVSFRPEDGGSMFHRNVYGLLPDHIALHLRR